MNNNDFMNSEQNTNTYQATRNLNTEIENPEININSATGVNIKDIPESNIAINNIPNNDNINNYFNQNLNENNNSINNNNFQIQNEENPIASQTNYNSENKMFITNDLLQNNELNNNINQMNNNNYENKEENSNENKYQEVKEVYQPTLKEKKKQSSFQIPPELKVMIFIVMILMLFIFVVPYIYDFIKEIELSITR